MGYALPQTVEMTDMRCPVCGVPYAMPEHLREQRLKDGESFHCPNGHSLSYKDNEHARTRKLLEDANRQNTRLAADLHREFKRANVAEQKLRRVHKGVCPDCKRSFANLAKHMQTKHGKAE